MKKLLLIVIIGIIAFCSPAIAWDSGINFWGDQKQIGGGIQGQGKVLQFQALGTYQSSNSTGAISGECYDCNLGLGINKQVQEIEVGQEQSKGYINSHHGSKSWSTGSQGGVASAKQSSTIILINK